VNERGQKLSEQVKLATKPKPMASKLKAGELGERRREENGE